MSYVAYPINRLDSHSDGYFSGPFGKRHRYQGAISEWINGQSAVTVGSTQVGGSEMPLVIVKPRQRTRSVHTGYP